MAFCGEKNQKLLFKVDSEVKFCKWFKYGLKAQKLLAFYTFTNVRVLMDLLYIFRALINILPLPATFSKTFSPIFLHVSK